MSGNSGNTGGKTGSRESAAAAGTGAGTPGADKLVISVSREAWKARRQAERNAWILDILTETAERTLEHAARCIRNRNGDIEEGIRIAREDVLQALKDGVKGK